MAFTIYPAIDIRGGQCVRLIQGDYERETVYGRDPVMMGKRWHQEGATWLHVVDLDAARTGEGGNRSVIEKMVQEVSLPIQVGGGVRNMDQLYQLLSIGVQRVILGSAVVDHPDFVKQALREFGSRVVVGIDAKEGMVATHGWLDVEQIVATELAKRMADWGAETFIFTDIARDGMLSGVNEPAVIEFAQACGQSVIASGGVRSEEDIRSLASIQEQGIVGAIVGKALYTGAVHLSELERMSR